MNDNSKKAAKNDSEEKKLKRIAKEAARKSSSSQAEKLKNSMLGGLHGAEAEKLNREMHRAAKSMQIAKPIETSLTRWFRALAKPFEGRGVPAPVNYAPAPSMISTTCTVTSNRINFVVAANTVTQIVLFPGHARSPQTRINLVSTGSTPAYYPFTASQVDSTSFHSMPVNMKAAGGSNRPWTIGPLNDSNGQVLAALGGYQEGLSPSGSSAVPPNWTAITPDYDLPFRFSMDEGQSEGIDKGHCRWRLDSMGIRVVNSTPFEARGGSIQSVQPSNSSGFPGTTIAASEINPTFKLWKKDAIEISWIPRFQDLAFWHTVGPTSLPTVPTVPPLTDPNTYQQTNNSAGLVVWLSAGSSAQTYSWEIIQNYSLAGPLVNSIAGPAPNMPESKPVVEHVITTAQNYSSTMAGAVSTAQKVVGSIATLGEYSASTVAKVAPAIARVAKAMSAYAGSGF